MSAQALPIRHTLMTVILRACGNVMLITTAAFIAYLLRTSTFRH